jgi:hypothetical protein
MKFIEVTLDEDCTVEQFLKILEDAGYTHREPDYIESDLKKLRGNKIKINVDKNNVVRSYSVPTPDLI